MKTVATRLEIPEDIHAVLKAKAAKMKMSLKDLLLKILEKGAK